MQLFIDNPASWSYNVSCSNIEIGKGSSICNLFRTACMTRHSNMTTAV